MLEARARQRALVNKVLDPKYLLIRLLEQRAKARSAQEIAEIDESFEFVRSGRMQAGIRAALARRQQ